MIFYETTIKNPSAMISMTGLTKSEFDSLLPVFEKAEKDYVMEVHDKNKERKRMPGGGRKPKLQSVGERLFFYPLLSEDLPSSTGNRRLFWSEFESVELLDSQAFGYFEKGSG